MKILATHFTVPGQRDSNFIPAEVDLGAITVRALNRCAKHAAIGKVSIDYSETCKEVGANDRHLLQKLSNLGKACACTLQMKKREPA